VPRPGILVPSWPRRSPTAAALVAAAVAVTVNQGALLCEAWGRRAGISCRRAGISCRRAGISRRRAGISCRRAAAIVGQSEAPAPAPPIGMRLPGRWALPTPFRRTLWTYPCAPTLIPG